MSHEHLFQFHGLERALNAAKTERKHLLLLFAGDGGFCKWCNSLEEAMAAQPIIQEFCEEHAILTGRVGLLRKTEDKSGTRERFELKSIPTFLLLSPDGVELARSEYQDGGLMAFLPIFEAGLEGKTEATVVCDDDL